ncbi:MAG: hypothetical protein H7Y15_03330 [Pseudonocardia sp.]|nr:hypothetical protein [Pseudonocardia sp.]
MRTSAAAEGLVESRRHLAEVVHLPMHDSVARLEATERGWVLYLDTDSPAEDRCWAMIDVLRVLAGASEGPVSAVPQQRIYLVR